jgi:hypothetical protein
VSVFPGITRNGVVNKCVENVLQTLFAQVYTPGLTFVTADAALAALGLHSIPDGCGDGSEGDHSW